MIFYFQVEKVSRLRHRLFAPDPSDPTNTVDSGKYIEELTLEIIPDRMRGGKGLLVVQLNELEYIGVFKPGDTVKAELTLMKRADT